MTHESIRRSKTSLTRPRDSILKLYSTIGWIDGASRLAAEKAASKQIMGDGPKKENRAEMFSRVCFPGACLCEAFIDLPCSVSGVSRMATGRIDGKPDFSIAL